VEDQDKILYYFILLESVGATKQDLLVCRLSHFSKREFKKKENRFCRHNVVTGFVWCILHAKPITKISWWL